MLTSKPHLLQVILQLHDIALTENLKLAAQRSFFMLLTVKHFIHEICFNGIEQNQSTVAASHKHPSPTTEI